MNMPSLKSIVALAIFILIVHALALANYLYWTYWWFDIPMHFLGGILAAMIFFRFAEPRLQITKYQKSTMILLAVCFAALVGVFWEFGEFLYVSCFVKGGFESLIIFQDRGIDIYRDTLKDLSFDLVGGLFLALIAAKNKISTS